MTDEDAQNTPTPTSTSLQPPISRGEFLTRSLGLGAFLTVPALLDHCATLPGDDVLSKAAHLKKSDPLFFALNAGITAPNPHNTQAWKFRLKKQNGPGPILEADLYVDETRLLPDTDPPARQIHIGQGTFLEHFALGALEAGCRPEISLFPGGLYGDKGGTVGDSDIGKKPVAGLRLIPSLDARPDPLFKAIVKRATNRSVYSGPPITREEFARIKEMCHPAASELIFVETSPDGMPLREDLSVIPDLLRKAFAIETNSFAQNEETRKWFRFNDAEIHQKRDGISLRGNGMSGIMLFLASHFIVENSADYWNSKEARGYSIEAFQKQVASAKGFVFFKTKGNTHRDHLLAGRDYARFHLAVTSLGLTMQPMSQIVQEYAAMTAVRERFEQLTETKKADANGGALDRPKIQMIARLGRSDYFFRSPRRDVGDMIRKG